MTHLIHYWQRLTQRPGGHDEAEAPVLELAGCFANSVMAGRQPGNVMRLAEAAQLQAMSR